MIVQLEYEGKTYRAEITDDLDAIVKVLVPLHPRKRAHYRMLPISSEARKAVLERAHQIAANEGAA